MVGRLRRLRETDEKRIYGAFAKNRGEERRASGGTAVSYCGESDLAAARKKRTSRTCSSRSSQKVA